MNKMFEQFQLNKEQMNLIEGGTTAEEYCATLKMIVDSGSLVGNSDLEEIAYSRWKEFKCSSLVG